MQQIIERVRKLLALSTSSNPHEAALAAAKVQELLQQYNLELSQVETATKEQPPAYEHQSVDVGSKRVWKRLLMGAIAHAHFCEAVTMSGTTRLAVIGQKHNIEVAHYLYDYLSRQLVLLW